MSNKLKGTALGRNAVIFLDVDGVLTSERCNGYYDFDLWAVNFFLWACEQSGAKIVMSSAWRNLPRAKEWFTEMFGKHLHKDWRTGGKDWHRGDEIDEWLEQHPEVDNFVIVDDTIHGLEGHKANLVFTSYCDGLLTKHMYDIKARLGLKGSLPRLKPMVVKDLYFYTKRENRKIGYGEWASELQERNARKLVQEAADEEFDFSNIPTEYVESE